MQGIGFYVPVIGFLAGILLASGRFASVPFILFLILALIALGVAWLLTRRGVYVVAVLTLIALGGGWLRASSVPTEIPHAFEQHLNRQATLTGTLAVPPDRRESGSRLVIEVEEAGAKARVIAVVPPHQNFAVGDRLSFSGTMKEPEPFATDGGRSFAYDGFLAKDGIFAVVQPAHASVVGRQGGMVTNMLRSLQGARDGFTRALELSLPEPASALAAGLVTGGKQGLGKELIEAFTAAGLVHIVVLSGYNVMIVAESILRMLRALPRKIALALAAFSIALFVLAAGAGAAAARAGLMALLGLLARATGRTYAVIRALFVSLVLMLLWSPLSLLHDPGFQFSFIATYGLIVGAPIMLDALQWIRSEGLRDIIASTLAAQIAVMPLLLYQTGNLSPFSLIANIFVLPFIPLAMALSTIAAFASLLTATLNETVALVVGLPAYVSLTYIIFVAKNVAALPFAHAGIPAFPFWLVLLSYAALAWLVFRMQQRTPAPSAGVRPSP